LTLTKQNGNTNIIFLILLNGVFSMSEVLVRLEKQTQNYREKKKEIKKCQNGTRFSLMLEQSFFLSTVQIGITLIGILTSICRDKITMDVGLCYQFAVLKPYRIQLQLEL